MQSQFIKEFAIHVIIVSIKQQRKEGFNNMIEFVIHALIESNTKICETTDYETTRSGNLTRH